MLRSVLELNRSKVDDVEHGSVEVASELVSRFHQDESENESKKREKLKYVSLKTWRFPILLFFYNNNEIGCRREVKLGCNRNW